MLPFSSFFLVTSSSGIEGVLGTAGVDGSVKLVSAIFFAVVKEVSGGNVVDLKLLKTDEQFLGPRFVIGSIKRFNVVEFWESFWKCSHR